MCDRNRQNGVLGSGGLFRPEFRSLGDDFSRKPWIVVIRSCCFSPVAGIHFAARNSSIHNYIPKLETIDAKDFLKQVIQISELLVERQLDELVLLQVNDADRISKIITGQSQVILASDECK
ncbi:MAG TPA: hypothetical protein V6C65_38200 [Allocoleopsis sp.]